MRHSTTLVGAPALALVGVCLSADPSWALAQRDCDGASLRPAGAGVEALRDCPGESFHPERLLVRFKSGVTRAGKQAVHDAMRAKGVLRDYHVVSGLQLVEVGRDRLPDALAAYQKHPDVLYAEPDYIVYPAVIPNDPGFGELWGMHNTGQNVYGDPGTAGADIRAPEAWDFWTGDPDFKIAVVDTGINYDHPDLQANIWTNPDEIPGNSIDDDGNGYIDDIHGYDFKHESSDPIDIGAHGTHVAGTIGAVANNNEGVVGVTWGCKLIALRFMDGNW